ncbi:hypothetical protein U2I53_10570 [Lysinibacillus capsici]|uniref:hypothetical protein n=1 Tax=Lysinibacillus capsici TaxID=2115968 RepID=UPI0032DECC81
MKKQVYKIDEDGLINEIYVAEVDENGKIQDEDKSHLISLDPPHGLFKAKWTGVEWIEGETEEEKAEREAQRLLESLKPSPSEISNAELEIKIVTMLTELEVIQ